MDAEYEIETRVSNSPRCEFCGVSQWCDQFKNMKHKDETDAE